MGKKKDKNKVSESDRASVAASSFNAAAAIVANASSEAAPDEIVETVMSLTEEFFEVRIDWMQEHGIGNAPKAMGGGGGNARPSGGSRPRSGGGSRSSGNASPKQAGFYGDLIDAIEENDGEAAYTVKELKKMSIGDASDAIDVAVELRDELQS